MDRHQAVILLKELIERNIAQPSVVLLHEENPGKFQLILQSDGDFDKIQKFVAEKSFAAKEDTLKGYCTIYKPQI